ncbi:peptidase M23 [Ectothiorhodospira sp. PHS-1]|uniref:peptidoglycan DD-metalloendopeptidase family protein n=1 Tax=Ectothiorhodospira sp. PHS-1 TaxID=519989 RepID=UPI00024A8499|nr:peptidase M23 [Ectothiorhodospira sp. PHS-1]
MVMGIFAVFLIIIAVYPKILSGFGGDASPSATLTQPLEIPAGSSAEGGEALSAAQEPREQRRIAVASAAEAGQGELQRASFMPQERMSPAPGTDENPTSYESFSLGDEEEAPKASDWFEYTIARGDRLSSLWVDDWGLPMATLYRLLGDADNARVLNRLRVGQQVDWQTDDEGYLTRLRIWTERGKGVEWERVADGWDFERREVQNSREITHMVITARVEGSISAALAGRDELSGRSAAALAVLLDRHLPVRMHARSGDVFSLLVEQETLAGESEPIELRLLAFDYQGAQLNISAARHVDGRFYTPEGHSLLPPFDRRPFTGSYRISSPFDLRRRHPVTGTVAPHHGTDFAMPIGTPIVAPADGRVVRVDSHPYAGRFLVIEHGQGYTTRYLHLSRALVRPGETVSRGQRIALSGNTGRSTGPHLHYELHVNGRPVDAMRAELPRSERLTGEELKRFQKVSGTLLAEVKGPRQSRQVAMLPYSEMAM